MAEKEHLILRQLKRGDEQALRFLFYEYYVPLVKFAESYLFDQHEAQDLVQNLFVKVWENAATIQIEKTLQDYLFIATKNRCLNKLESLKVRDKHQLLFIEASMVFNAHSKEDNQELLQAVDKAIDKLPPQIKKIIELKYRKNKKVSEIAVELGVSENTVKTQLKRGKAKLKASLGSSVNTIMLLYYLIQ